MILEITCPHCHKIYWPDQFKSQMELNSAIFYPDGRVDFYFDDDCMYSDHAILVEVDSNDRMTAWAEG